MFVFVLSSATPFLFGDLAFYTVSCAVSGSCCVLCFLTNCGAKVNKESLSDGRGQ